jgi:hypothetical protein
MGATDLNMSEVVSKQTERALNHLRSLKPYDGWSTDFYIGSSGDRVVMLRRRNVPLTKGPGFLSIAYDEHETKTVVGITKIIGDTGESCFCRGIVLVEQDGSVSRNSQEIRIRLDKNRSTKQKELKTSKERMNKDLAKAKEAIKRRNKETAPTPPVSSGMKLSEEDTSDLAKLGLMFIAFIVVLRILASFKFLFNAIIIPIAILYGIQTCPTESSFDAKKELKRVLRGKHLPDGHRDKPANDWFSQTIARVTASVGTELTTAMGYEVSFMVSILIKYFGTIFFTIV